MPSKIHKNGKTIYRACVMVNGKRKERNFPDATKDSFRKAVQWEKETKEALLAEFQIPTVSLAMGDWVNEYLDEALRRFSTKTYKEKTSVFSRFFRETGISSEMPVTELTTTVCRKYLNRQSEKRSGYAANKDRKNLAAAWSWGGESLENWPKGPNPFLSIRKYPEERKPRYVPLEGDFWKVIEVAEGQDRVMLLAFLHLGARRKEIFNLKWSDIDFENRRVRLWTRKRRGGHQEFDWIPMTTDLRDVLLEWWEERLSQNTADKEHVFVCLTESPFCNDYFGKPFVHRQHLMKRLCERAGVKPFGFHAIRHLTASILYRKGQPTSVIQAILRHKNPHTTSLYLR